MVKRILLMMMIGLLLAFASPLIVAVGAVGRGLLGIAVLIAFVFGTADILAGSDVDAP